MNSHNAFTLYAADYLLLHGVDCPFSREEFQNAEMLADGLMYEKVISGDAGDIHKLHVGRFRRDIHFPEDLHPSCNQLMKIIDSEKMQKFYKEITGFKEICIRRAQANILHAGDYVGLHVDGETKDGQKYPGTHKDYKYAIVLNFNASYEGGDTIIYPEGKEICIKFPPYSMFIISGSLPHKVNMVSEGVRKTLVYFLSDNFGFSLK